MVLACKLISVAGVKDEDFIGSNDLYVKLSTDEKNWVKSTVKRGAGKQAVFDELFTFDVLPQPNAKLYVEVYDKDPLKDDKLGSASVSIADIGAEQKDVVVELHRHIIHRHAGVVNLRVSHI
ncbi:hypothetical protein HDU87_001164 [Geranomyces variabilis]|uniref:C2 domain-containing protein n=1 Tax=Geranomyces variabilis TaxID=109894 RepID=A0AAD5TBF7_9FUNG|nr:hypothetical protein HDU87_001164 [Geranomyces variabilis]